MPAFQILAATGNAHKVREMAAILAPAGIGVLGPDDVGGIPEVVEDGATFRENAVRKAAEIAAATGRVVVADDSGLEVMALGGAPGVYSARYAGPGGNDGRNVAKLLAALEGIRDRRARFVCVIAVAAPNGDVRTAEGEVRGRIIAGPRGDGGFGYDPVFVPEGHTQTFAELPPTVKNGISHRRNALAAAIEAGIFECLATTARAGPGRPEGEQE
ncbi:MAG: RdgB/HAM1 family non-canonical purine NTP pyrophosphatase [Lentisphaeria bacterium]|nr:RdgB/HAM1 family non-canonical purine NTP pyrophosphatase [Lentisphaeria bacterium]